MRPTEASRHLDAVGRTFVLGNVQDETLPMGKIGLETVVMARGPVPISFKRFDFLATKGELSEAEFKFLPPRQRK